MTTSLGVKSKVKAIRKSAMNARNKNGCPNPKARNCTLIQKVIMQQTTLFQAQISLFKVHTATINMTITCHQGH